MEVQLERWIRAQLKKSGELPKSRDIKEMACKYSKIDGFKASKGWLEKFLTRNGFSNKRVRILTKIEPEDKFASSIENVLFPTLLETPSRLTNSPPSINNAIPKASIDKFTTIDIKDEFNYFDEQEGH